MPIAYFGAEYPSCAVAGNSTAKPSAVSSASWSNDITENEIKEKISGNGVLI